MTSICELEKFGIEETKKLVERLIDDSGIPTRYRGKTFANFETGGHPGKEKALVTLKEYAQDFNRNKAQGRCITITGGPGTGKTLLACCLAKKIIQQSHVTAKPIDKYLSGKRHAISAVYTTEYNYLRNIKNAFAKKSDLTETEIIQFFADFDLLIIDEIGIAFGTEAEKVLLYQLINKRYEYQVPTLLISNLNCKDLTKYSGERVMDRMRENNGIALNFNWPSYRK